MTNNKRDYTEKRTTRRKKSTQNNSKSTLLIVLVSFLLVVFLAILYFLVVNRTNDKTVKVNSSNNNREKVIPPKPEERWRYIKELENRSVFVNTNTAEPVVPPKKSVPADVTRAQVPSSTPPKPTLSEEQNKILNIFKNDKKQPSLPSTQKTESKPKQPVKTTNNTVGNWGIQCGSFQIKSSADKLKAKLGLSGINSEIVKGSKMYRVLVGKYPSQAAAKASHEDLKKRGINNCIVVSGG